MVLEILRDHAGRVSRWQNPFYYLGGVSLSGDLLKRLGTETQVGVGDPLERAFYDATPKSQSTEHRLLHSCSRDC